MFQLYKKYQEMFQIVQLKKNKQAILKLFFIFDKNYKKIVLILLIFFNKNKFIITEWINNFLRLEWMRWFWWWRVLCWKNILFNKSSIFMFNKLVIKPISWNSMGLLLGPKYLKQTGVGEGKWFLIFSRKKDKFWTSKGYLISLILFI